MATKGSYVDGFVLVVSKKNLDAYKKMATLGRDVWMKHGALDYKECVIDDAKPQGITLTFSKMAKTTPSELIVFSYIVFKSRAHRDAVNKRVMKDPAMDSEKWKDKPMPIDMKKMAYAGFKVIVEAK